MFYENLFYFDIETAGEYKDLQSLKENDDRGYNLFCKKYENNQWIQEKYNHIQDAYLNYASIFSTFGKIVCISFGYYHKKNQQGYSVLSIYGDNELDILEQFRELLDKVSKRHMLLSGYRIKSFDIPWVIHKMNKYGIEPPKLVDVYGKKPWEIMAFDLADEWKQQFRHYVSFDEVAYELGIESPKDDIDGSMVHNTYWSGNGLTRIKTYCEKDVVTCLRVGEKMLKYKMI